MYKRQVICGAYGHGNSGDEAILKAIIDELRAIEKDMRITVVSKRRGRTKALHAVHAVPRWNAVALRRELRRAKLYINGGGSLIQDVTSRRSLFFYLHTIVQAKKCGCRVQMYGCGIGPINNEYDRRLSAAVMDKYVDVITLRDPDSMKFMEELKVTKPELILAADPVLNISARAEAEAQLEEAQRELDGMRDTLNTMTVREEKLTQAMVSDTGAFASLGGPVLERACTHAAGPYAYENFEIEGRAYYTNNPPAGAFRGFGVTQTCFCT